MCASFNQAPSDITPDSPRFHTPQRTQAWNGFVGGGSMQCTGHTHGAAVGKGGPNCAGKYSFLRYTRPSLVPAVLIA